MDKGQIVEKWNPKNMTKQDQTIKLNNDSDYVNQFIETGSKK